MTIRPGAPDDDRAPLTPAGPPMVALEGIVKRFPGVVANDDITLAFHAGEVHCLLGENGAGKSTLMNILSGVYRPDEGRILLEGREVELSSPRRAIELGIGMVHQHLVLAPALTVLENLMLGAYPGIRLSEHAARARLAELAELLNVVIDPDVRAGELALGQQQQVEIIKALWRESRVLILDEPTSMLTPQGVEELARVLIRLRDRGYALIFISHKLREAITLGDRVSFLRGGRVVGGLEPEVLRSTGVDELQRMIVSAMFGDDAPRVADAAELQDDGVAEPVVDAMLAGHAHARDATPLLELTGVSGDGDEHEVGIKDASLRLWPGEIMGVAGVDGNGQRVLAELVSGHRVARMGTIHIDGAMATGMTVGARERLGVRYVTDDSLGEGAVGSLSIAFNMVIKWVGRRPFWERGRTQRAVIEESARSLIAEYDVKAPNERTRVSTLSGGNLRKVVLARELAFNPRLIVYNKPTYGLDVRTTLAVRDRIRDRATAGVASLVISTDLEELLSICGRIAVLLDGRVTGIVDNDPSQDMRRIVGELMVGADPLPDRGAA